jgi:hypothetical protein
MASVTRSIHEVPETRARFVRQLENGQSLEYHLHVLQQPERARACGMGAKCMVSHRRMFFWRLKGLTDIRLTQPMPTVDQLILRP